MYGKIYPSMFTGSMFGQGFGAYAIMSYAIANARPDQNDTVELNPPYLSAVFGEDIKRVEASIDYLCSPDAGSRSPEHGGRRLVRTDQPFTYTVVNLNKYRNNHLDDTKREFWRKEKAKYRQKISKCPRTVPDSPGQVLHADADADADAKYPPNPPRGDFVDGVEKPKIEVVAGSEDRIEQLRKRVSTFVGRPNRRWDYEDERLLVEVAKNPNCLDEMTVIESMRKHRPRSAKAILGGWETQLDKVVNENKEQQTKQRKTNGPDY